MEQPVDCTVEDIQASCGDNGVSGMSVIAVESTSLASVRSDNSSINEVDDYDDMVDVDVVNADVEDVASSEKDAADKKSQVLDIVQCSIVKEESAEANVQVLSKKFCMSEVNDTEVTDDVSQCDSSFCKTSAPENTKESSVSTEDVPFFPIKGSSNKCDDGLDMASGNNATLESGIVL